MANFQIINERANEPVRRCRRTAWRPTVNVLAALACLMAVSGCNNQKSATDNDVQVSLNQRLASEAEAQKAEANAKEAEADAERAASNKELFLNSLPSFTAVLVISLVAAFMLRLQKQISRHRENMTAFAFEARKVDSIDQDTLMIYLNNVLLRPWWWWWRRMDDTGPTLIQPSKPTFPQRPGSLVIDMPTNPAG